MTNRLSKDKLLYLLYEAEIKWRWWQKHEGSNWSKRLKRVFRYRLGYLLFLISKNLPMNFTGKAFFRDDIKAILPEHFYWFFLGVPPDDSEIYLARYLIKHLKRNDILIDVGAHLGFFTLLGSNLIKDSGMVYAFEPTPHIFDLLIKNTVDKPNIRVNNIALSDIIGEIEFFMDKKNSLGNSIIKVYSSNFDKKLVRTVTLDSYCRKYDIHPTFIKIDVEGGEERVIRGARQILKAQNLVIVIEFWRENNKSHKNAAEILLNMGYKPYRINVDGEEENICVTSGEDLEELIPLNKFYDNFLFRRN